MNKRKLSVWLALMKPNILMSLGLVFILLIGVLGEIFSWASLSSELILRIIGWGIFAFGFIFHAYCHKFHEKAHETSDQIQKVVASGPFSAIRHPMYLSLILMYFGMAIGWGVVWMLIPALLFSILSIITAIEEEKFLLRKLGPQYGEYMKKVPWRFIPKIF
jgi:protein-S-isoprenylcysteine O-methyltransferase Ste14